MIPAVFLLPLLLMSSAIAATANEPVRTGYFRAPALSGDTLAFVAEGDLWRASSAGGSAQRLTTHPAEEFYPAISPDGKRVAFSARYEGPMEIYVMPLTGGAPTRLTYDGGGNARVQGWTTDGKVLFSTTRLSGKPGPQLVMIDPSSLARSTLPLADAAEGCYLGGQFIFTRRSPISDNVKRYKGGGAQSLWSFDPSAGRASSSAREATPLTASYAGTSRQPMCAQNRVYFLSDRDGSMNLWSMTGDKRDLKQHTRHSDWDIKSASLSNGRIAYQLGADIRLLDVASGEDRIVPLQLLSDFDQLRTRWLKAPFDYLTDVALSPNGERVALTARGQVFTTSVGPGRRAEITRTSEVRARGVAFSHDGGSVYTFADATGELELWRYPANGVGAGQALTRGATTLRVGVVPSPDGKLIAHTGLDHRLFVLDVASGEDREIVHGSKWSVSDIAWSPDSRWLSFASSASNNFSQVSVADVSSSSSSAGGVVSGQRVTRVTSDRYDARSPVFSSDGKFLYFIAERNLQTVVMNPWGSRNTGPFFDRRGKIYALALTADARWPFLPKDELTPATPTPSTPSAVVTASVVNTTPSGTATTTTTTAVTVIPTAAVAATPAPAISKAVSIAFDGLASRLYEVPLAAGNYRQLATDGKRLYFVSVDTSVERKATLRTLAIEPVAATPPQSEVFFDDVRSYALSQDQKKVLLRRGNDLWVVDAGAKAPTDLSKLAVNLRDWTIRADPRDEWKHMFVDAWRMHRDMFWDANMHGAEWPAVRRKYEPLLSRVTDRSELNDLIAQMISEAVALHSQVGTQDLRRGADDIGIAALGAAASYSLQANGFRIDKIFSGDPELIEERSPLARAEVNMAVGDVITQVNGVRMDSPIALALALRQQAGVQTLLRVLPIDGTTGATVTRDVVVTPITAQRDAELRYLEWEQSRAAVVETSGQGKLAYVHLQAMGPQDIARFVREFFPVINRDGLIIDLRGNGGGSIDSWVIDRLQRKAWQFWKTRRSDAVYSNQQDSFRGHVVALIDGGTYSDGETMAEGLKRLGIGTVIGTRTAGAGIWLSDRNRLRDNGIARVAESGVFVSTPTENRWIIEGVGVTPDITVDNLPVATFNGGDAQLDAAISFLQDKLKREPIPAPTVPPMPARAK